MSENGLIVQEKSYFLAPAATLQQLGDRYNQFNAFISKMLVDGTDYQTIPGTNKPSLVKPGAEKLATFYGLSSQFEMTEQEKDWTGSEHGGEAFFYFKYRCTLLHGDQMIASCEGSCNSFEVKYRYRQAERVCPTCGKSTIIKGKAEYGGGWLCFAKKGGCGAKFQEGDPAITGQQVGRIPNPDVADIVNTLQKMAQKRAFVGAVLLATNSSERFTQDTEDMSQFSSDVVEAEFSKPMTASQAMSDLGYSPDQQKSKPQYRTAEPAERTMITVNKVKYVKSWIDPFMTKYKIPPQEVAAVIDNIGITAEMPDSVAIGALDAYFTARKNVDAPATKDEAEEIARAVIANSQTNA